MESITLIAPDTEEEITLYVLEETKLNEQRYLLATSEEDGDAEGFILKEVASDAAESTYEFVEDDVEYEAVVKIFQELVEDTDFEV